MKKDINIKTVIKNLKEQDVAMNQNQELNVDSNKIKKMTMDKIKQEKNNTLSLFTKKISRIVATVILTICIGGVCIYAGDKTKFIISDILGISQTETLSIGEYIKGKDYKLTVVDTVSDSYIGWITLSIEAISDKAKESFQQDNMIDKFECRGDLGYGLRSIDDMSKDNIKYFSLSYSSNDSDLHKKEIEFILKGINKGIKIPLKQTVDLKEMNIDIPQTQMYPIRYYKIKYSEIGFTLYGKVINQDLDTENIDIGIDFLDGSHIQFYHRYSEQPMLSKEKILRDNKNNLKEKCSSIKEKTVEENTENITVEEKQNSIDVRFDDVWFSGGGQSRDGNNNVLATFRFKKRFNWNNVKSININGTNVNISK